MLCSGAVATPSRSRSWTRSQRERAMCKPRAGSSDALASQPAAAAPSSRRSSVSSSAKRRLAAAGVSSASAPSTSSYSGAGPSGTGTGTASEQRRGATSSSSTSSASSSRASLAAARASLPDPPVLYPFQELAAATNSFLAKRAGGSASAAAYWRCSLRGRDAALFQLQCRPGPGAAAAVDAAALARIGRYHHTSLARLLGACPAGAHLYLAYELPPGGATLAACLRSPRNPSFTALRTWVSRVQVAADVAQGLEYVHHHAGSVHGRVSPAAVIVSDPGLRARLTHFGAVELADPAAAREAGESPYAAPDSGEPSREADVYAFGVLLLELLSGEEPARGTKEFQRVSVLETAAAAAAGGSVRNWVDRRLGDSFPIAAAERLVEVALRCAAAEDRPDMTWVAGKISKVYLESRAWEQKVQVPTEFSVSVAPR
uniref:Protein kinase domain-containing protein n=1 Tax=Setaria italica TaxID=4555 RepID=K3XX27_SETIT